MASVISNLAGFGIVFLVALTSAVKGQVVHALVGESVVFSCENNSSISNTTVEWKKHNTEYRQITYRDEPTEGWTSTTLRLDRLLLADSGAYECLIVQNATVVGRKTFSLQVSAEKGPRKPTIAPSSMSKNISVFANEKITLRCIARSQEALYTRWYHQQRELSNQKTSKLVLEHKAVTFTSKLTLEGDRLRDGLYTCFVFNQYGTDSKSIYVEVKPVPPKKKEDLAAAYEQRYLDDEAVPLGVVIGIPVSILIIVLAAILTVYERYSWRHSGRNCKVGQGERRRSIVKAHEVDINKSTNVNKKKPTNLNGEIPRSSLEHITPVVPGVEAIQDHQDTSSISNKSSSSFRPDIDLEWEGVELRLPVDASEDEFTPKPSIALPEDDLSFSGPEELWVLCDKYTHRTRPVVLAQSLVANNTTETIV